MFFTYSNCLGDSFHFFFLLDNPWVKSNSLSVLLSLSFIVLLSVSNSFELSSAKLRSGSIGLTVRVLINSMFLF